jgi:ABC-type multidrug transport system fused ATPase/permease subunit
LETAAPTRRRKRRDRSRSRGAAAPVLQSYLGQKPAVRRAATTAGINAGGSLIDALLLRMVAVSGFTPLALPWLGLWAGHAAIQRLVVQPKFRDQVGRIGDRGTMDLWQKTALAAQRRRPPRKGPSTDAIFDDVEQVSTGWQLHVPWLALDSLTVAGAVAGAAIIGGPILGLAMGATAAVIALAGKRAMRNVADVDQRQHETTVTLRRRFRDFAHEHGWDLFRRMGAGEMGRGRIHDAAKDEADAAYAARKPRLRAGVWTAAAELAFMAGTLAWAVISGNPLLALGPMILATQAFSAAVRIPQNLLGVKPAMAAAERLSKFQRSPADVVDRVNARDLPRRLQRGVEIDRVTFGHEPGKPVLQDLTLQLRPGTVTAVLGQNAAGKTTFIDVLQRKHDVWTGSIRFDGIDAKDAKLASIDRLFGRSVPQSDYILAGTLRQNLAMGDESITEQQMLDACRKTGLDAWFSANHNGKGFDVDISEESLSGGTKQRISLARLLVKSPGVVYLDEPTSALDIESQGPVLDNVLEDLRSKGSVVLLVSHNAEALQRADQVAVFDQGHVADFGRPAEVLARRDGAAVRRDEVRPEPRVPVAVTGGRERPGIEGLQRSDFDLAG